MKDLFTQGQQFAPIPLPDAEVAICHELAMPLPYDALLQSLIDQCDWRQESVRIYGKVHAQPRLVALYGDPAQSYEYSGLTLRPLAWTGLLSAIKDRIENCTGARFNAVFLNLYRDNNDSMGLHSDDERELGQNPVIASLSFGAARNFVMKHKFRKDLGAVKIPLSSGTVLLMKGATQHNWKHGINKQTAPCGPRVNLTFRTLYS